MKIYNFVFVLIFSFSIFLSGCKKEETQKPVSPSNKNSAEIEASKNTHTRADGSSHEDHDDNLDENDEHQDDHSHDEVSLGTVKISDMEVELAQGHGLVEAGKESHLVVKLPYNDKGETIVRAWIGTDDRTMSLVGKGEYAPSHDDYDIHATAPDPLPENVMWWIEIQKPDGSKLVGSANPMM